MPGDHVVFPDDAYGGTFRLFAKVLGPWGVEMTPAAVTHPDAIRAAIRPGKTKVVWLETPTNPLLNVADIAIVAQIAHDAGALLVVDNTFASPYLQQPLELGADVVVHSTTKYMGGHSDVVGGALVVRDADLADKIAFHQNAIGAVAGPFDAWLVLRGIKTLGVRMDRHSDNAEKVVEFLQRHKSVSQVLYPGIDGHPGHETAAKQMKRYGGIVSFRVTGGEPHALDICNKAEVFTLGESLGGVESLIEHPGKMTHASVAGYAARGPGRPDPAQSSASRQSTTCCRTSTARCPDPWAWWSRSTSGRPLPRRSRWTPARATWSPEPSTAPRSTRM